MNTVLVVDDEPEVRSTICQLLSGGGFNAHYAANGREAIDKYQQLPIDVVITDLQMPEMDGNEIVRRLKQLDEHVAAIILTASRDLNHHNGPSQVDGVYNYLTKPLAHSGVIVAAVKGALENRRLRLENQELMVQLQAFKGDPPQAGEIDAPVSGHSSKGSVPERGHLLLEQLYHSAPLGMCQLDAARRITTANAFMAKMVKTPLKQMTGGPIREIHPFLSRQLLPVCYRIHKTGKPMTAYTIRLAQNEHDGSPGFWLASSYPLRSEDGAIVATSHYFQDMTELREAQEHIRLSKIMLQSVFDGISDPLVMVDANLEVRMFNQAARRYHRVREYKDLIGKPYDGLGGMEKAQAPDRMARFVASGRAMAFERPGRMDDTRVEKVTIYPLSQSAFGLDGAIIQITDITETKSIESRILQTEKQASLGLLVSGVAHEINNPNNFIMFNVPILKAYMNAVLGQLSNFRKNRRDKEWFGMSFEDFSGEVFRLIRNLEHGTHRIADIVDNLRTLVNAESGGRSRLPCDMATIVRQVDVLCRSEIQEHVISFEVVCPENLPLVQSDPAALEQVLINLLINAAHAANKPDSRIRLTVGLLADRVLQIKVEDNGAGMDRETLAKIFDPFFTTKDPGLGAGLGLSVCHSLVKAMGGTLDVKSELNSGTVFNVAIPVRHSEGSGAPDPSQALPRPDQANPTYA